MSDSSDVVRTGRIIINYSEGEAVCMQCVALVKLQGGLLTIDIDT